MKRFFDIFLSLLTIVILSPFFLVIAILIAIETKGGIFYVQSRVGRDNKDFNLYKFRSMRNGADKKGLLTIGENDNRITKIGYFIRKYKIDEFPQLINILKGEMSIVGPRPEVRKYVALYNEEQLKVLSVKPGLTDYASIAFIDESNILSNASDPEAYYINKIMPLKIKLNLQYIKNQSLKVDFYIIGKTLLRIL
ncbi:sugar transferase [Bacteroidales bacterium OttesenSCG-928-B11]|nr:sugar transferase [Bacteroidales bacterium OttesenSCG-928-C03]MDL2312391.1 sugar transferase [Bacteroidales bacterium OttesenSCG-928-B11]MDL2326971.1 sugar transferase [Bacteroidales bacterium OttesenSCG-928-A14]